jgi:flagellar biosynthetic protein FliR
MGLAMAQTVDPNMGRVPVLASFLIVMSTLIFLSIGGHLILIQLILMSFEVLPIGGEINFTATLANFIEWSAMVFLGGILIALPIMLTMMLVNLCIGIVTRAAPALNIFAVGFPAMTLAGMVLFLVYLVNIGHRIEWLWLEAFSMAQDMWVVP